MYRYTRFPAAQSDHPRKTQVRLPSSVTRQHKQDTRYPGTPNPLIDTEHSIDEEECHSRNRRQISPTETRFLLLHRTPNESGRNRLSGHDTSSDSTRLSNARKASFPDSRRRNRPEAKASTRHPNFPQAFKRIGKKTKLPLPRGRGSFVKEESDHLSNL